MMNSQIPWSFNGLPPLNTKLYILIEEDIVDPEIYPYIREAELVKGEEILRWKLLDFDQEIEEEFLHQYFNVVAWRLKYVTT